MFNGTKNGKLATELESLINFIKQLFSIQGYYIKIDSNCSHIKENRTEWKEDASTIVLTMKKAIKLILLKYSGNAILTG